VLLAGRERELTGSLMKPTDLSFLDEEEEEKEEVLEVLEWTTAGMVSRRMKEGMVVVGFLRILCDWKAVAVVVAKAIWNGIVVVTLTSKELKRVGVGDC
jgi:hypothetical protein